MATITRRDGQQFVVQAYRELLAHNKNARSIKEVRALAEQHGQFVRVFEKDLSTYEVSYATEPGFLLGETVRHYFGYAQELMYCEYLPESRQVILVVIRSGNVFIDTKVSLNQLGSELAPALTGDFQYAVHIFGDVPISRFPEEEKIFFPDEYIASFDHGEESLFGRLPTLPSFQLLPLPYAIKSAFKRKAQTMPLLAILLVLVAVVGFWVFVPKAPQPALHVQKKIDPYAAFYRALKSPPVTDELNYLTQVVDALYGAPGWHLVNIDYKPPGSVVLMTSDGGSLSSLQTFAHQQHFNLALDDNGAQLSFQDHLKNQPKPEHIYPIEPTLEALGDHIDGVLQQKSLVVGQSVDHGATKRVPVTIELYEVSPQVLAILAQELKGMPVVLSHVSLKYKQGLLTGLVNLSVWGA